MLEAHCSSCFAVFLLISFLFLKGLEYFPRLTDRLISFGSQSSREYVFLVIKVFCGVISTEQDCSTRGTMHKETCTQTLGKRGRVTTDRPTARGLAPQMIKASGGTETNIQYKWARTKTHKGWNRHSGAAAHAGESTAFDQLLGESRSKKASQTATVAEQARQIVSTNCTLHNILTFEIKLLS